MNNENKKNRFFFYKLWWYATIINHTLGPNMKKISELCKINIKHGCQIMWDYDGNNRL